MEPPWGPPRSAAVAGEPDAATAMAAAISPAILMIFMGSIPFFDRHASAVTCRPQFAGLKCDEWIKGRLSGVPRKQRLECFRISVQRLSDKKHDKTKS